MANIALTFTPDAVPFNFDFSSLGVAVDRTAIPRSRICFRVNGDAVAAKIATNTQSIVIVNELPENYAYTLEFIYVSALFNTSDDVDHYTDVSYLAAKLGDGEGPRYTELISDGNAPGLLNVGLQKVWHPLNKFNMPMFNEVGQFVAVELHLFDSDAVNATAAGTVSSLACFLQYDLEQAYNVAVNFPLPVQQR